MSDENERLRGEVAMLLEALNSKTAQHTHLQNLLTQCESDRDVARAERDGALKWVQHLEGLIARTVKRTLSDTGWCPVCDGHHAPVEDWQKDCPAWKERS